jgi:hypothetical protein
MQFCEFAKMINDFGVEGAGAKLLRLLVNGPYYNLFYFYSCELLLSRFLELYLR